MKQSRTVFVVACLTLTAPALTQAEARNEIQEKEDVVAPAVAKQIDDDRTRDLRRNESLGLEEKVQMLVGGGDANKSLERMSFQFLSCFFGTTNISPVSSLEEIVKATGSNSSVVFSFDAENSESAGENLCEILVRLRIHRIQVERREGEPPRLASLELLYSDEAVGRAKGNRGDSDTQRKAIHDAIRRRIAHSLWANARITGPQTRWLAGTQRTRAILQTTVNASNPPAEQQK